MDDRELTLVVVGIEFPNADKSNRRFEVELCAPGDAVDLRPEPKNKHDRNAVAVFRGGGGQLGYISAERAPWIGAKIAAGEEWCAVFQGLSGSIAYIRVKFGGGAPALPDQRSKPSETEVDFYPDDEFTEWGA